MEARISKKFMRKNYLKYKITSLTGGGETVSRPLGVCSRANCCRARLRCRALSSLTPVRGVSSLLPPGGFGDVNFGKGRLGVPP
jgi:hypothetical protein